MAKFCTNCGKEVDPNAVICIHCGCKVANTAGGLAGDKSKLAAGILGILLGCFGVHNFYLGYKGKAIAQLLITLISCFTLSFVSGIWGLIEGIMILAGSINVDGSGNPLKD